MEIFKHILSDIKNDIRISREKKKTKKRIESLTKFFDSSAGRKHFEDIRKDWDIKKVEERKIKAIDNDNKEFRLVIDIEEDNFVDIVHDRKPKILKYRITHQTDTEYAGDLLIEVNDKIAVQTSGILFPQTSGVKGIFDKISDALYTPTIKNYPSFEPWKELTMTYAPEK